MFDDNQNTLARIAVPGHVIFGKKDAPIGTIDDEKYFELRVTRFWLYRATRLRKVSTIRITHSCMEAEARIMVYGVEIRANEKDRHKSFYPVLSYISAYGSPSKPNACFDLEQTGSITAMGGSQSDTTVISEQLSMIDFTILIYIAGSVVFFGTSYDLLQDSFFEVLPSIYKGLLVGVIAYCVVLVVGLLLRYLVKFHYALRIGIGFWSIIYYCSCAILVLVSTCLWIYNIVRVYRSLCPDYYGMWGCSISVAIVELVTLGIINLLIVWLVQSIFYPKLSEQYLLPEDGGYSANQEPPSARRPQQTQQRQTVNYHNQNIYGTNYTLQNTPTSVSYKTLQTSYNPNSPYDVTGTQPQLQQTTQKGSQQQHATQLTNNQSKTIKKVGSNESTGSTYYQQLMKTKGGVKSISQYGELLKQKKASKQAK